MSSQQSRATSRPWCCPARRSSTGAPTNGTPTARNLMRVAGPGGDGLRLLAATHERWLYLALLVRDDKLVFDASDAARRSIPPPSAIASGWPSTTSAAASSSCSSAAPAPASCVGAPHRNPRIRPRGGGRGAAHRGACGSARATATCWRSASRCRWWGSTSACSSTIATGAARARTSYGTLEASDLRATGRLIAASPDLNDHLRQFAQPGVELTVASSTGAMLTRLDAPALPGDYTRMRGFLPRMYRLFLDGDAIPRSVSQAERAARRRRPHRARGARQAGDRAVRRPLRKQRHRRRGGADLFGRRQAGLRRHPARADRRSLAHAARPRAHAPAESHAVRHAVRGGRGLLVRRPHDPAHLAARARRAKRRWGARATCRASCPRPTPATSSATCRAASPRCWGGSTSTPATCARWPASWRTRSARR